jgi:predicted O-methyltransferase YrrM
MSHLPKRDSLVLIVLLLAAAMTATLGFWADPRWAHAALAILIGLVGAVMILSHAWERERSARRSDRALQAIRRNARTTSTAHRETEDAVGVVKQDIESMGARLSAANTDLTRAVEAATGAISQSRRRAIRDAESMRELLGMVRADNDAVALTAHQDARATQEMVEHVLHESRRMQPELITELQAMQQLLLRYAPRAPLPIVAGWALSPTGLVYLTDLIERRAAELVVECGSGTSTLWMAMAMKRVGRGRVISLEHLDEFAEKTRDLLEQHGVSEWVDVRVCPLVDVETPRGEYPWYDLDAASLEGTIDILLVDGPPGSSGPHARYPAIPRLGPSLSDDCVIVVDDMNREDERRTVRFWLDDYPDLERQESPGRGIAVLSKSAPTR